MGGAAAHKPIRQIFLTCQAGYGFVFFESSTSRCLAGYPKKIWQFLNSSLILIIISL